MSSFLGPKKTPKSFLPATLQDAQTSAIIPHVGKYARDNVLIAFEMIGGTDALAAWARDNPGEFYTKLYTKIITKEVEINDKSSIEDLLSRLDSEDMSGAADGRRKKKGALSPDEYDDAEYEFIPEGARVDGDSDDPNSAGVIDASDEDDEWADYDE